MRKHFVSALIALLGFCSANRALAQTDPGPAPAPGPSDQPPPANQPGSPESAPAATTQPGEQKESYAAMAKATPGYTEATSDVGGLELRLNERALIPVVRVGFVSAGSGTYKVQCDGAACGGISPSEVDYNEKSGFILGADLLFRVIPKLRLGFGVNYIPTPKVEDNKTS